MIYRRNSVIVESRGGLGNQLFQYALGFQLASSYSRQLIIDANWHTSHPDRPFEILEFLPKNVSVHISSNRIALGMARLELGRRSSKFLNLHTKRTFDEKTLTFDSEALTDPNKIRFRGYFQSWRYFSDVNEEVISSVLTLDRPSKWFTEMENQLAENPSWLAIHVRRGDYETSAARNFHGLI